MTLMELLGMERLQLQTRSELETLRQEARAAQVTVCIGSRRMPAAPLAAGLGQGGDEVLVKAATTGLWLIRPTVFIGRVMPTSAGLHALCTDPLPGRRSRYLC